jgi:hypothetical protein
VLRTSAPELSEPRFNNTAVQINAPKRHYHRIGYDSYALGKISPIILNTLVCGLEPVLSTKDPRNPFISRDPARVPIRKVVASKPRATHFGTRALR